MSILSKVQKTAACYIEAGSKAHATSSLSTKAGSVALSVVTVPVGVVVGAGAGIIDRALHSIDTSNVGHPQPDGSFKFEGSQLLKTGAMFAGFPLVAVAGAAAYDAFALATGAALISFSGAATVGIGAALVFWGANTALRGGWAGIRTGIKGAIGAARIGASKAAKFLSGGKTAEPSQKPPRLEKADPASRAAGFDVVRSGVREGRSLRD